MKLFPLGLCAVAMLSACQVSPNAGDTSNATLKFRIHYQQPGLGSPHVEVMSNKSVEAGKCVFVASPFGVAANAADPGGIRSIVLGPSGLFGAVKVRQLAGDTVALPSPSSPTQTKGSDTFANPGTPPGSAVVQVSYSQGKAFDTVNLLSTYEFTPGSTLGALRGTVHNFGTTTGVSEVFNFYVRPATNQASQQPGMACQLP
jgi:predicted RecA/RadA family phage recombinase